jgi:serine protease AprX
MKLFGLLFFLIFSLSLFGQDYSRKFTEGLNHETSQLSESDTVLVWVFFTDKGKSLNKYFEKPTLVVSKASLERRAHVIKSGPLIDQTDLPVNRNYVNEIESYGARIKNVTKWFNGVACYIAKGDLYNISELNFVRKIDFVGRYVNRAKPIIDENYNPPPNAYLNKISAVHTYDYGQSLLELEQIKVPEVQDLGYTGNGITICVMDAGVSNLQHEVFQNIKIKAKWDFVNHDSIIANQPPPDSGDGSHGTWTLALIGGFMQGQLIGPAFDATYLLAKTENTQSESSIEEDNWIAAAEWADSIGVQVTSTSLGYRYDFTWGTGYTWQDMNGHTAIITLGAEMAAKKGIVVVNSVGNDASMGGPNTLNAPADGDSVIAVGAVDLSGNIASFSSYGPTADGRIKPDVVADGVNNYIPSATPNTLTGYTYGSGTSFSCPLVAGVAALILQAHPSWTPRQVRDALRNTASNHSNPDSLYGWGIINALAAINYNPASADTGNVSGNNNTPSNFELAQNFPNPFNPSTTIKYEIKEGGFVTLNVYNLLGNLVATLVNENQPAGTYYVNFNINSARTPLPSGVYFYRLQIGDFVATKKMVVMK